eukprot:Gregarina_sp_Pseudo_9__181@NODE_111_length_4201_cov_10_374580_g103_i0_p2_GENE_NODE_111_length_4201_cov_10_374580_g103_i0NODE_111_length_4201_cov_10_374580_g103_i0_p2_ORF_typecomplete_len525_score105_56Nuc_sug_transp/PF04142_15/9_9e20UAA/PF08449_11/7_4e18CRTlike/PF08627_10/8_4e18CRTlike/PF08627_10/1_7e03SLC35F/PF06027_12/5_3e17TPT/PF03151_16/2_3e03TPT/PF03151_16/3_5e08PUNUT/PF16913_5/2_9e07Mg_trans_NIPA/PF05653_14/2e03Mg_trans_NIPA/PF05653_14/3_3_NODE_111_length_4201_cov_10_374580_g103_i018803454
MLSLINPSIATSSLGQDEVEGSKQRVVIFVTASILVIVSGVTNLLVLGWGVKQVIATCSDASDSSCAPATFNSPFTQQLAHSLGQGLCLIVHALDRYLSRLLLKKSPRLEFRSQVDGYLRDSPSPLLWLLPAIFDFAEAVLTLFAGSVLNETVVQVFRNLNVAMTAAFAGCLIGVSLRVYHWVGIGFLTIGCTVIGLDGSGDGSRRIDMLGIFLTLIGTCLSSFLLVYEESVFRVYRASPFEAIGWIGFFEVCLSLFAFGIAHGAGIEHIDVVWFQLRHSATLRWSLAAFMLSVAVFTVSAICTTKLGGAIVTVILFATRQAPLWLMQVWLGWVPFRPQPLVGIALVALAFAVHTKVMRFGGWCPSVSKLLHKVWICRCRCILVDPEIFSDEDDEEEEDFRSRAAFRESGAYGLRDKDVSLFDPYYADRAKSPVEGRILREYMDFRRPTVLRESSTLAEEEDEDTVLGDLSGSEGVPMPSPTFLRRKHSLHSKASKDNFECWIYVDKEEEWEDETPPSFLPNRE